MTPKPLVAAHVDLQDFKFMPLDVQRLRDSDLVDEVSGDEFRAAVLLWCAAWHQVPAGSLPNSEATLARFSCCGRGPSGIREWRRVRKGALRGFVECSDGRLYHAVLAEKVEEAWVGKLKARFRRECERIKKSAQRAKSEPVYPTFEEWRALNDVPDVSPGHAPPVPRDSTGTSLVCPEFPDDKGQGQGQGQGQEKISLGGSEASGSSLGGKPPNGQSGWIEKSIDEAAGAAWAQVEPQLSAVGATGKRKIDDPIAERVIAKLGWGAMCRGLEADKPRLRVEFKRHYAELARPAA